MTLTIDIHELPSRLEEALKALADGEVILSEGAVPLARLVPLVAGQQRVAGLHPGAIEAKPNFDAPLPDEFFWTGEP